MENDKKIKFKEVIYSSSQKSIVSGMSGFGVRTHSSNVNDELIDILSKNGIFGYELSSDRMVGMEQLQNNPRIVYDYPETFIYRKIRLANGIEIYIFSRTIYLGIDYGYFCGSEQYRRTGSNYFTHALIFDEQPPKEIFDVIVNNDAYHNNVFLPLDYTCSPNNKELTALLTGEPELLSSNSFDIISREQEEFYFDDYMGLVISGVFQKYINDRIGSEEKKLIIKADKNVTKNVLNVIKKFIPQSISSNLTFISNYVREGVPDNFDIILVNEFYNGTLYEELHICIDLLNGHHTGIEQNFLFDRIKELIKLKDIKTLKFLLEYVSEINIDSQSDFKFLYNVFILTKSDKEAQLTDLTSEFIDKLAKVNLSGNNKEVIWKRINNIINNGLQCINEKEIITTLSLLATLKRNNLDRELNINLPAKEYFSKILFDTNQYFGRIVNSNNIDIVSQIVIPSVIGNTDRLFGSLQTTDSKNVWDIFIGLCFPNNEKRMSNANLIIAKISGSPLSSASQNELLLQLYPISGIGEQVFFNYFTSNPNQINKYPSILSQVCRKKPLESYPELIIKSVTNQTSFNLIVSELIQTFSEKINTGENTHATIGDFLAIIKAIPGHITENLNVDNLILLFVDSILNNPSDKYKSQIDDLMGSGLKIKADKLTILHSIQSILKGEISKEVNIKVMVFAYYLSKEDRLKEMFNKWMKQGFSNMDLLQFIEKTKGLNSNPQFISYMITSIWNSTLENIKSNREIFVETIIHNVKCSKDDYNKFIKSSGEDDLISFISKSTGLFNRILKKLFG